MSECPFASGKQKRRLPMGAAKRAMLYEEYTFLRQLREVWDSPLTEDPVMEPSFAAAMHGIELGLLLLTDFLCDNRRYVSKIHRVHSTIDDITQQCKLLVEITVGAEGGPAHRYSLAQPFPYATSPPITQTPSVSPGLKRFEAALRQTLRTASDTDRESLTSAVATLTGAAYGHFERWSVGLGVEPQLDSLREAVGLPARTAKPREWYLDYEALVRPSVPEQSLITEIHPNPEDFFFRTVNVGTDCWAFVVLALLRFAAAEAKAEKWETAAALIYQVASILEYMGSHVQLLMLMNMRDYLLLKVELEGTSGEGSVLCKAMRGAIKELLRPLAAALLGEEAAQVKGLETGHPGEELGIALMEIYENPETNIGPYTYAKALETLETGLLGGFYYKHFSLATNVIGTDAKGTSENTVRGLKLTYETPVFPVIDRVKFALGVKMDSQLEAVKGRVMDRIVKAYLAGRQPSWKARRALDKASKRSMMSSVMSSNKLGGLSRAFSRLTSKRIDV